MEKGKFFYNEKTLRYERVEKDKKGLLINLAVLSLLLGLIAIVIYILTLDNFSFYQNKEQELSELKKTYNEMQQNLTLMQKTLDNLHQRDSAIYKQILEQQPGEGEKSADKGFKTYSEEEIVKMRPAELTGVLIERVKAMRKKTAGLKALKTDLTEALKTKEQMLKAIPSIRPVKSSNYRLEFISGFGYRKHPVFKILKMHKGIDFAAFEGTAVYATGHGKVQRVEFNKDGYGKCIVIDHGYDFQSVYAHLSTISIKVGQDVKRGQIIGRVGNSGGVSPHLHYEILHKKKRINPIHFCREGMSPQEYSYFFEKAMVQNQALSIH
jgi:murein DD-endopeptidase MepM/ murein hydrolase activator NlpD